MSSPLSPALRQASIRDAEEREVGHVAPQVLGERGRVRIAAVRAGRQALPDDVRQPRRDVRAEWPGSWRPRVGRWWDVRPEHLGQDASQRVDVGSRIDPRSDRPPRVHRRDRGLLLGGHVAGRAAHAVGGGLADRDGLPGQVEIQQHRLAVGRQEYVRRLDVHVDQPAVVGVLKGVGQAGADPADRMYIGRLREEPPRGAVAGLGPRARLLAAVEDLEDGSPRVSGRRRAPQLVEHPGQ